MSRKPGKINFCRAYFYLTSYKCIINNNNMGDVYIEIRGNRGYLVGERDYIFLEGLDLELSYIVPGAEFSKYAKRGWDCRKRLLRKDLSFSCGLVHRVVEFYKQSKKEISVIDRNKYVEPTPINILPQLKKLHKEPRYYQNDAVDACLGQHRGIVKLPTGAGKTLVSAMLVARVGKPSILFVIGKSLLWQTHKLFEEIFNQEIGAIGDGVCVLKDINVASIWSVGKALGVIKPTKNDDDEAPSKEKEIKQEDYDDIKRMLHASCVNIFDECHMGSCETFQRIAAELNGSYNIGLSASPRKGNAEDLLIESVFGNIIINISASELIEKGYLVPPRIKFIPVEKQKSDLASYNMNYKEIYKEYIVHNDYRNGLIVRAGASLVEQGFTTLVLYREIAHGMALYDGFVNKGIHCHNLSGSDDTERRNEIIAEVMNGKCKLLLASNIFDLGLDLPALSGLILTGAGNSLIRTLQRIGRVIRPSPETGKTFAAVIDFEDKAKYLKQHSLFRKHIYQSEPGFEVI